MLVQFGVLLLLITSSGPSRILAYPRPFPIHLSSAASAELPSDSPPNQAELNKYFHEPGTRSFGEDDRLGHHDSRFFHGLVSSEERIESLTHMTRAYLATFRRLGLETWIAHGTLLGWWWNGKVLEAVRLQFPNLLADIYKILPWDWDVDTQVSGATLQYLANHHNQTTYGYVSEDQQFHREYLLDVNPWSRQRDHGDGANIIDARWIDTTNGLYIDITGLSELQPDQRPGIWSCKNFHNYHVRDLYPMRESLFEGVPAQIPYAYHQILAEEYQYQALVNITHHDHRWHEDVKQWLPASPGE